MGAPSDAYNDPAYDGSLPSANSSENIAFLAAEVARLSQKVAEYEEPILDPQQTYDMFLVMNACMVLFMQSGFALLEAGAVRAKNVTNILIKNLLDACVGAIVYWACGFAFAYGKVSHEDPVTGDWSYSSSNSFIGHTYFFLMDTDYYAHKVNGYPTRVVHNGSTYGEFFFNFVFAATATTIISGALAERVEFGSYLIYGVLATGFIQPVTVHWGWSNGWLVYPPNSIVVPPNVWYRDYAGGGNVHAVGGVAALIGCLFIGPRIGRFEGKSPDRKTYHIPGHSTPLTCLGAFILIIGFLSMVLGHGKNISQSVTNLTIGGAMGGLTAMFISWAKPKIDHHWKYHVKKKNRSRKIKPRQYWSFLLLVDGMLAGMVAMCAGCDVLETWGAAVIGMIAGLGYYTTEHLMHHFGIDDPVGSVPVHLVGGVTGVLLTPIFAGRTEEYAWFFWKGCEYDCVDSKNPNTTCKYNAELKEDYKYKYWNGWDSEGWNDGACLYTPFYQLAWQIVGITAVLVWTSVLAAMIFWVCWYFQILRVDKDVEVRGIDISKHGEPAYPQASYGHGWDTEGQFAMEVLMDGKTDQTGKRNVKALINPNKKENWTEMSADAGLIALAIAYRDKYYKNPNYHVDPETGISNGLVIPGSAESYNKNDVSNEATEL